MRVWILIGGAAFFAVLTMCLAKVATSAPSGWAGFGATISALAVFIFVAVAASDAE